MNFVDLEIPKYLEDLQLPDPALLNVYRDLENRIIWVDFEVSEALVDVSKNILRWNAEDAANGIASGDRKPIKVFLFSYGGSVDAMFQFVDICSLSKTPIVTVDAGVCYSAALIMLLAGHIRYTLKHANAMLHNGSGGMQGDYDKLEDGMKNYKKVVQQMQEYVLGRTNIPKTTYSRKSKNDWYFTADEMLEYGIVDAIIEDIDQIL